VVVGALIAVFILWLRFEYGRVVQEDAALASWQSVAVRPLASALAASEKRAVRNGQDVSCEQQYPTKRAWFGALHVHTAASYDATSMGSLTTADDAYRFAQGAPARLRLRGDPADYQAPELRISSPLDFMAVTDHAESLGEVRLCYNTSSEAYSTLPCKLYRGDIRLPVEERLQPIMRLASFAIFGQDRSTRVCGEDGSRCLQQADLVWQENQRSTEAWHDSSPRCAFTAFHGYEYTLALESSNLHRNVIFKSDTVPQSALSAKDARNPEQLWEWLDAVCIRGNKDCDALAIPHNSNWSSGRMWFPYSNQDLPLAEQQRLSALRAKVEPLVEIAQAKGDSECRNGIASVYGAPDEFCDFEKLRPASEAIEDCDETYGSGGMLLKGCVSRYSFARYALTAGLKEEEQLGVNPFKMGIVAATDTHNGLASAGREKNSLGTHGTDRNIQNRLLGEVNVPGDVAKGSPVR